MIASRVTSAGLPVGAVLVTALAAVSAPAPPVPAVAESWPEIDAQGAQASGLEVPRVDDFALAAPPAPPVPDVRLEALVSTGDLERYVIRRNVKRQRNTLDACYHSALVDRPWLEGDIAVQFYIGPGGAVRSANGSGVDARVAACIADVVHAIRFPAPHDGGGVLVNASFHLVPFGVSPVPELHVESVTVGDADLAPIRRAIRHHHAELEACLADPLAQPLPLEGDITVQLGIASDGSVADASAVGLDPVVTDCMADVIRTIAFPAPRGGGGMQVRYPLHVRMGDGW